MWLINLVYELGLLMLRLLRVVVWVSCRMMCIWNTPWRRMAHPRLPGNMVSGYCTTQEWSLRCIFRCIFHAVLFPQFYTRGISEVLGTYSVDSSILYPKV